MVAIMALRDFRDFQLKKYPKIPCGAGILPVTIKDRQDAYPTKLGKLFFGVL